mgnify:CR=1 FL=1
MQNQYILKSLNKYFHIYIFIKVLCSYILVKSCQCNIFPGFRSALIIAGNPGMRTSYVILNPFVGCSAQFLENTHLILYQTFCGMLCAVFRKHKYQIKPFVGGCAQFLGEKSYVNPLCGSIHEPFMRKIIPQFTIFLHFHIIPTPWPKCIWSLVGYLITNTNTHFSRHLCFDQCWFLL